MVALCRVNYNGTTIAKVANKVYFVGINGSDAHLTCDKIMKDGKGTSLCSRPVRNYEVKTPDPLPFCLKKTLSV